MSDIAYWADFELIPPYRVTMPRYCSECRAIYERTVEVMTLADAGEALRKPHPCPDCEKKSKTCEHCLEEIPNGTGFTIFDGDQCVRMCDGCVKELKGLKP